MQIDERKVPDNQVSTGHSRNRTMKTTSVWQGPATISVGRFLRRRREALGLSKEKLEELASTTPWRLTGAAIDSMETGKRFPELQELLVYHSLLDVCPSSLLELARIATRKKSDRPAPTGKNSLTTANLAASARNFMEAQASYRSLLEGAGIPPRQRAFIHLRLCAALEGCGAPQAAAEAATAALRLAGDYPDIGSDAMTRIAALHLAKRESGEARKAAEGAVRLARKVGGVPLARAFLVRGRALLQVGLAEEARGSFHSARKIYRESGDRRGKTEATGEIGLCLARTSRRRDARRWIDRAVRMARRYRLPDLEGSWLVVLGRLAHEDGDIKEAGCHAIGGMRLGRGKGKALLAFRAGWLRFILSRGDKSDGGDRKTLDFLCKLYPHLESHRHVREVREFGEEFLPCLYIETPE